MISSTTNVAVDRVLLVNYAIILILNHQHKLQSLMQLGFEDFVRVGSVKKIAKKILPFSTSAVGADKQELNDLKEMLEHVRGSEDAQMLKTTMEKIRRGENRRRLSYVTVVGVTCASASLNCLDDMKFPLVLLDECCQMTEPNALLPMAR